MADVLIRDVPDAVLAAVDAHASRLGLSRVEYIRRRLAADAATSSASVSAADLRAFADKAGDLADSPDAALWAERIERGMVRITTVTRLEVGYSARSGEDARAMLGGPPLSAMPVEYLTPAVEDRTVEVQLLFELLASITGQPTERLRA